MAIKFTLILLVIGLIIFGAIGWFRRGVYSGGRIGGYYYGRRGRRGHSRRFRR